MPPHLVTVVSPEKEKKKNQLHEKKKPIPTKTKSAKNSLGFQARTVFSTNVGQDTSKVIKFKESIGGTILKRLLSTWIQ